MSEENLSPEGEDINPDTDTGDVDEGEAGVPPAIPVAEPSFAAAKEAPAPPPPAPAGPPRVYPEQYRMLFANTAIFLGCLTVWERAHVMGVDVVGFETIGGAVVAACAGYSLLAGVVGLIRGGVNFFGTLLTGFLALYFAIRNLLGQIGHENFKYLGDLQEELGFQGGLNALLGQVGPGIYLNLIGGLVIFFLFFKAMFGGKKKEPAPAPRRRGRR